MIDPRTVAERILGQVDWQTEVSGFCQCPGESLDTHPNGGKDCRVNVDGAPTVFCFHSSCIAAVTEANRQLRRELGASPWEIALPGGRVLRSGDVLQKDGEVRRKVESGKQKAEMGRGDTGERVVLETVKVLAERFRPELFEVFRWPASVSWAARATATSSYPKRNCGCAAERHWWPRNRRAAPVKNAWRWFQELGRCE